VFKTRLSVITGQPRHREEGRKVTIRSLCQHRTSVRCDKQQMPNKCQIITPMPPGGAFADGPRLTGLVEILLHWKELINGGQYARTTVIRQSSSGRLREYWELVAGTSGRFYPAALLSIGLLSLSRLMKNITAISMETTPSLFSWPICL